MDKTSEGIVSKTEFVNDILEAVTDYRSKLETRNRRKQQSNHSNQRGMYRTTETVPFRKQLLLLTRRVLTQKVLTVDSMVSVSSPREGGLTRSNPLPPRRRGIPVYNLCVHVGEEPAGCVC
eukprot:3019604-Pyramimonas_sp.AAC.1